MTDLLQQAWERLVRFVAVEDGQEHLGEPVDKDIDSESTPKRKASCI